MPHPDAQAIEDLVSLCRQLRVITDRNPQLKPVALELLQMSGPLPRFEKRTEAPKRARTFSAAQRKATSQRMKRYWAARKKEQKKA